MRRLQKWVAAGILGLGLAVLMPPHVASAQGTDGPTGGVTTTRDDDGFDYGWLGLLGLAGLAGLMRRDRHTGNATHR